MSDCYREDLAYIHDVGYGDHAVKSSPEIIKILDQNSLHDGLIVDLGCGSGISALEFTKAGYRVLGIDISESMIAIAKVRAPSAEFCVTSLFKTAIPHCQAVTAIGE
ncbi:MAG: methyltransferase domain-containing protein, partial [Leptolyngbya sp. SIO3F4]|nr:methyltransferase domain-containing protein [Leptolyngbya sp. SIO3F4]